MDPRFSAASLFTTYTSLTALVTLIQQFYNRFVPEQIRDKIATKLDQWFKQSSRGRFTLVVSQYNLEDLSQNLLDKACELYISDKLRSAAQSLRGGYKNLNDPISYRISQGDRYVETLDQGRFTLLWDFVYKKKDEEEDNRLRRRFELSCDLAHKDEVLDGHLPSVVVKYYERMMKLKTNISLYTFASEDCEWIPVEFKHPFSFDALALDPKLKQDIICDLDKFISRKEFYTKVGKAWKRGYLLYGPPGTGKTSLVAAMANYLKFDIYDLQLDGVKDDATLRSLMLSIKNKSILVIEDIDCIVGGMSRDCSWDNDKEFVSDEAQSDEYSKGRAKRETGQGNFKPKTEVSLQGLLNFIDGLWSSCGSERIIVFTTNEKDKIDPALLRPGRMDMHIHMTYLTMPAFRVLAKNYLDVTEEHSRFKEIQKLLETANVTPARVAEELMRFEDADGALSRVVDVLKARVIEVGKKKGNANEKTKMMTVNADLDQAVADENSAE